MVFYIFCTSTFWFKAKTHERPLRVGKQSLTARLSNQLRLMSGTSLQELMELGGWKSYEMVLRYAHLAPEQLASAAARIEQRIEPVEHHATISLR